MALSISSLLLLLYVGCETVRANYAYYAFHNFPQISASLIALLSEALKLSIAIVFLVRSENGLSISSLQKFVRTAQQGEADFKRLLSYALPAALYLINNLIYYTVLPKTTPSLLQVCVLAKLPTTGILHHYMIKRQRNIYAWYSLLFLCIGLAIFNIPSKSSGSQSAADADSAWYLAPIAGFVIACLSALASIAAETSTKTGGFWESQAYLYVWGIVFSIIAYPLVPSSGKLGDNSDDFALFGAGMSIIGLVVITAGTGLVVAVVLRARDNILKVIGTAASLVTIAASQYILLPELRASTFTPWRVCGGGVVATSTWCYNHYSQVPWVSKQVDVVSREESGENGVVKEEAESLVKEAISDEPEKSESDTPSKSNFLTPNRSKIMACAIVVGLATIQVAMIKGI